MVTTDTSIRHSVLVAFGLLAVVSGLPLDVEIIAVDEAAAVPHLPLPDGHVAFVPRIIGGTLATLGEFPGSVSLQTRQGFHFCGGTLIDMQHVLTAAHCMTDDRGRVKTANTLQVMGDDLSIQSVGSIRRQTRRVSHIFVHTGFNLSTMLNDVAVVRVEQPFWPTDTFRAAELANATPAANTTCHVAGWGATVENGTASARLQRMSVAVLPRATCNRRGSYEGAVRAGMICAGTMLGGRDSCQGDSGGGLICGTDGRVAGVVSFGYGCARPNFPGVYADVSGQQAFVRQALGWSGGQAAVPVPTTLKPSGAMAVRTGSVGSTLLTVACVWMAVGHLMG